MFFIGIVLTVVATAVTVLASKKPRDGRLVLSVLVSYVFAFNVGFGGLLAFSGHVFMSDEVARKIGWAAGNPFQLEVAAANLAFGVLGLMAIRASTGFRLATAIGYAVFLIGDGVVHVREAVVAGNDAPLNTGAMILFADLVVPLAILALVLMHRNAERPGTDKQKEQR